MNKRIILVGPTAGGKTFIRDKFREKGYKIDISYTTREPREGEENGTDYIFVSIKIFEEKVMFNEFYEWVNYGKNYYGTGFKEWHNCEVFIMETDGIKHIKPEDRKDCVIIYVNTPVNLRYERMKKRGWEEKKISERLRVDNEKFKNFKDYDFQISSEEQ